MTTSPTMNEPYICTHSGLFHADDVLAVATLKSLPAFAAMPIRRDRDAKIVADAACAVDVGFIDDPESNRFDHHQTPRPRALEGYAYSAFGLVWKAYGEALIARQHPSALPGEVARAFTRLRLGFIRAIDETDNGEGTPGPGDFAIGIEALNGDPANADDQLDRFTQAVDFARKIIAGLIADAVLEARDHDDAVTAINAQWLKLLETPVLEPTRNARWRAAVLEHNARESTPKIDYVLEPRSDGMHGLTAVPVQENSFASRRLLPENLRGQSQESLEAITGRPGLAFVHATGFYACGAPDLLLEIATQSLSN